jgi:hypothetical protein
MLKLGVRFFKACLEILPMDFGTGFKNLPDAGGFLLCEKNQFLSDIRRKTVFSVGCLWKPGQMVFSDAFK